MNLTKRKYNKKLKTLSKKNVYNSKDNLKQYNKEYKEFQKDGDIGEIYEDLNGLEHKNYLNDLKKRDVFL